MVNRESSGGNRACAGSDEGSRDIQMRDEVIKVSHGRDGGSRDSQLRDEGSRDSQGRDEDTGMVKGETTSAGTVNLETRAAGIVKGETRAAGMKRSADSVLEDIPEQKKALLEQRMKTKKESRMEQFRREIGAKEEELLQLQEEQLKKLKIKKRRGNLLFLKIVLFSIE